MTAEPRDPELRAAIERSEMLSTPDPDRVRSAMRWGRIVAGAVAALWVAATVDAALGAPISGRIPAVLGPMPLRTALGLAVLGLALTIRPAKERSALGLTRIALASGILFLTLFTVLEELVSPQEPSQIRDLSGAAAQGMPLVLLICVALLTLAILAVAADRPVWAQRLALVPLGVGVILANATLFDPHALTELSLVGDMSILAPPTLAAFALSVLMQTSSVGFVALGMGSDETSRSLRLLLPLAVVLLDGSMFVGFSFYEAGLTSRGLGFGLGTGLIIFVGGVLVWAQSSRFHRLDMRRLGAEHVMESARQALAERDAMARRLRASQRRLRSVLDTSSDAYIAVDDSGLVTEWNDAATQMFGWTYSEAVESPLDTLLIPEEQRIEHRKAVERFLRSGRATATEHPSELVAVRKDKSEVNVEIRIWPTVEGDQTRLHAFIRDITDRKQAEAELLQANRELEEFAAVAAHDLRSPLVAIALTAELIAQQEAEGHSESTVEWAGRIVDATRRGGDLIDDLIALTQVSSSSRRMTTVRLDPLVREVADQVVDAGPRQGVVEVDHLPDVTGDAILLRQLFVNLIANSFKYVPEDREPKVTVTGFVSGGSAQITIRDNGDGIPPDDLPHVFDMFHRGTNTLGSSGSGIGLAICWRVVERHNGSIWVSNPPEGGARFDISLPRRVDSAGS